MFKKYLTIQKPSPRVKSVLMLLVSLGLGVAGVFYSRQYIENQVASNQITPEAPEVMVEIVVPNRPMIRGEIVSEMDLSLRDIPQQYADSNTVTAIDFQSAIGQRLDFDIDEGRPLLWAHLAGGLTPTFSGLVADGLRAMTVRVDEINSISGFLQPGDKVDLLLSHGRDEDQKIFPLIQTLDVIATGTQTQIDKVENGGMRSFATITVHVSPENAQKITLAQQVGKLTAVLRNPEDILQLKDSPLTVTQLFAGQMEKTQKNRAKPKRKLRITRVPIEYIIGGTAR